MAKPFAVSFYNSKKWKVKRKEVFNRNFGLCEYCNNTGEEVHHKIALTIENINDVDITLGDDNLVLLCKDCHFAQHKSTNFKQNKISRVTTDNWTYFTEEGSIEPVRVVIVHGAPCSGKSTFVRESMSEGDLVVDVDSIKQCLSYGVGDVRTNDLDNLLHMSFEIRDMIYELVKERSSILDSKTIWIVAMLPTKSRRKELAYMLGAELIHIDTDMRECIARLSDDHTRRDKQYQRALIINYFERFEK